MDLEKFSAQFEQVSSINLGNSEIYKILKDIKETRGSNVPVALPSKTSSQDEATQISEYYENLVTFGAELKQESDALKGGSEKGGLTSRALAEIIRPGAELAQGFSNLTDNSIYSALVAVQNNLSKFAQSIFDAVLNNGSKVKLWGIKDGKGNDYIEVDISTAAGAMAVSLYLEQMSNIVQVACEIAASKKKNTAKVWQTVG